MSQQINLYQAHFRREKQQFSSAVMARAAAAIVAGTALLYGVAYWQVASLRADVKEVEARQAAATKKLQDMTAKAPPRAKSQALEQELARAERELAALTGMQAALQNRVLANTRGFSEYFVSLARQHVAGMWLTGFDILGAADQMRLQGRTQDPALVLRFVQRLASEKSLAGTEFEVFQMSRPEKDKATKQTAPYVEFLIRTAQRTVAAEETKP